MSELVIHIGTHKTATTLIQNTLAANRLRLLEQGMNYPAFGRPTGHHVLATPWIRTLPAVFQSSGSALDDWASIPTEQHHTFLSSEEFSRAHPNRVNMAELRALTERFDRVRVLCVLRNQLEFMQSVYLEVIKSRDHWPLERFVNETIAAPDAESLFFDPNDLLDQLLHGFPPEDLIFMPYQALKTHAEGPLAAIFERLDWPIDAASLDPVDRSLENRSCDPLTAWVAHQISRKQPADDLLKDIAAQELAYLHGTVRTSLFSREEVTRITSHFKPLNERFLTRMQAFDPKLTLDPFPSFKDVLHRNDLGGPIWFRIARALYADQTLPKQEAIKRLA